VRDRIVVRDLLVRGIVGINPEERRAKQDVVINLDLEVDTRAAAASDDIADAVNYRSVCKRIIEHVESASPFLVEKLAADIAAIVLAEFGVERVRVRVEKPGALRFARSVGVEVERSREDAERRDDG
jgi:7,8-dihydroneopterin aldolase/epimerase/oxygenase